MITTLSIHILTVLDCGGLPDIANGATSQPAITGLGAITMYACDAGFTLLGTSTRMCGIDEMWTNSEPSCAGKGAMGHMQPWRLCLYRPGDMSSPGDLAINNCMSA